MPANHFGIRDRGFVKRGYVADLVLFNLSAIGHPPDYRTPDRDPTGIDAVLIGGEPAVWGGEWLGRRLGERLLPG
jgi:N-acyl-D-amino-acid deacylase